MSYVVFLSSAWKNVHHFVAAAAAAAAAAVVAAAVAAAAAAADVDAVVVVLSTLDLLKKVNLMYSSCSIKARVLSLPAASILTNI